MTFMVTADTVAKCLNMSRPAIYQLTKTNQLPFESHHFGKAIRFKRTDIESYLGVPLEVALEQEAS